MAMGRGEGEHRDVLDVALIASLDNIDQGIDPRLVPHATRHESLAGPTAIAIHHDGDMTRKWSI